MQHLKALVFSFFLGSTSSALTLTLEVCPLLCGKYLKFATCSTFKSNIQGRRRPYLYILHKLLWFFLTAAQVLSAREPINHCGPGQQAHTHYWSQSKSTSRAGAEANVTKPHGKRVTSHGCSGEIQSTDIRRQKEMNVSIQLILSVLGRTECNNKCKAFSTVLGT